MKPLRLAEHSAQVPTAYCPHCGKALDADSHISREGEYLEPKPGSFSVCVECGTWLVFRTDLSVRAMDVLDVFHLDAETHEILMETSKLLSYAHQALKKLRDQ
jgi:hypothetical protein